MTTTIPARHALTAALAITALVLAACGDDDSPPAAQSADPRTAAESPGSGSGDVEATCDAFTAIDTTLKAGDPSELPSADQVAAFARDEILPHVEDLRASAPDEVTGDVAAIAAALTDTADTGSLEAIEAPEFAQASTSLREWLYDNCAGEQVEVELTDFAFDGLPDTLPAGERALITLTNHSTTEMHELLLFQRNPGTTEPLDELLALPQDQVFSKVTFVNGEFGIPPGDDSVLVTQPLEAGDYIAICMVPQGATPENHEGDGPPHAMSGMTAELTVR